VKEVPLPKPHPEWFHEDITKLFDLLAAGHINPIIAAQIPLEKAAEAHRLLETGQVRGKVVLTCVHNC
jgi:NADPH:quinone reductase-like Zn-dependent oxidoreductase